MSATPNTETGQPGQCRRLVSWPVTMGSRWKSHSIPETVWTLTMADARTQMIRMNCGHFWWEGTVRRARGLPRARADRHNLVARLCRKGRSDVHSWSTEIRGAHQLRAIPQRSRSLKASKQRWRYATHEDSARLDHEPTAGL